MRMVYVARLLTRDDLQLDGRALVRHFRSENEVLLCAAIVPRDSELLAGRHSRYMVTEDQLADVDAVFMEGGWNLDGTTAGLERFRFDLAEKFVRQGGQLVVADVDQNVAEGCRQSL